MIKNLSKVNIILASNSPRRQELLKGLDIPFSINVIAGIDEDYPLNMACDYIPEYLSKKKAKAYASSLKKNDLLITADTLVILNNKVYGKPKNAKDAECMLKELSGHTHSVVTGVCLFMLNREVSFTVKSEVRFAQLNELDIQYYVEKYNPLDKAGAYGIQEWIGYIGVENISGSYYNIMGLPVQRLYTELEQLLSTL